jgi:hypothetical protein
MSYVTANAEARISELSITSDLVIRAQLHICRETVMFAGQAQAHPALVRIVT